MSIKVLGGFLGNTTECSQRLLARVETHLQPLAKVSLLRDFGKCDVALQVQLQINRFCANTSLTYFMRVMGVAASRCHLSTYHFSYFSLPLRDNVLIFYHLVNNQGVTNFKKIFERDQSSAHLAIGPVPVGYLCL